MLVQRGKHSFELVGPYAVLSGLPCVGDENLIGVTKRRLAGLDGQQVRITVDAIEDDDWREPKLNGRQR